MPQQISGRSQRALKAAHAILQHLEQRGKQARLVGGCVRDRQLGLEPKDFDIATDALPEEFDEVLAHPDWKLIPTGLDHGTITVVTKTIPVEVTSLREDMETDGRRALVRFGASFEHDAARRDFTINAMSEDLRGQVYDYFSGRKDLAAKRLRFVGDPSTRIAEDYLRMMRFFRFWARFQLQADPKALEAIAANAKMVQTVSQERITSELILTLDTDQPQKAVTAMADTGILSEVLGTPPRHLSTSLHDPFGKSCSERPLLRLCQLLRHPLTKAEIRQHAQKLRLSKQQARILEGYCLLPEQMPAADADRASQMEFLDHIAAHLGDDRLLDYALPALRLLKPNKTGIWNNLEKTEVQWGRLRRQRLPIKGDDLTRELGLQGAEIGQKMAELLRAFRNGAFSTRKEALDYLRI